MSAGVPGRFTRAETAPGWPDAAGGPAAALREALAGGEVLKDEEETLLLRAPLPSGGAAFFKLTRVPPRRRLLAALARSRGLREWRALRALDRRGVRVVEALAYGEDRGLFRLGSSLVVTREEAGARDLRRLLQESAPAGRRPLLEAAGAAARRLHDAGCGHFRMQLRNFLVPAAGPAAGLIVLDAPFACVFPGPAPARVRRVDLVDLAGCESGLGEEDARQLLRAYAGSGDPPLTLAALRSRRRLAQKFRRIALYLFHTHTGHRPAPAG